MARERCCDYKSDCELDYIVDTHKTPRLKVATEGPWLTLVDSLSGALGKALVDEILCPHARELDLVADFARIHESFTISGLAR
jgi:hypothetical protein